MSINLLDYFLVTQLSALVLIFFRVGTALMVLPGFGEVYVPPRARLLFAILFSLILTPMLQSRMPALPSSPLALGILMLSEIMIGAFMGLIARAILVSLHAAGNIIAVQSSLAVAAIFDPQQGGQNAVISNLLTLGALVLFFALDLHHMVLAVLVRSYDVFAVGPFAPIQDMNILHLRVMADAFSLGVALSAPFIVVSLLFYLAGGLMTRVMPNFQVFFVMMAPQIMLAFFLLIALVGSMMDVFAGFMENQFTGLVERP